MGRGRRKQRTVVRIEHIDATPERLAKGDESEFVNPAHIDSGEQPIGLTRRFRASHIDRLHRNGKLTWVQWYAGDWFRNEHHRARFGLAVVASYGERTSAGENSYGLPRTEAQLRARRNVMAARAEFPPHMIGFMERLLIHDALPKYGGNQHMKQLTDIRKSLDALALWLRMT